MKGYCPVCKDEIDETEFCMCGGMCCMCYDYLADQEHIKELKENAL